MFEAYRAGEIAEVSPSKTPPSSGPEYTRCRYNINSILTPPLLWSKKGNIGLARHEAKLLSGLEVRSRQHTANVKIPYMENRSNNPNLFYLAQFSLLS